MTKMKSFTAKVETHPRYKTPRRIYDVKTQASRKSPRKIAEATLKKIAGDLKIKPDLSQLHFDKVRERASSASSIPPVPKVKSLSDGL